LLRLPSMLAFHRLPRSLQRIATSAPGTYAAYLVHGLREPGLLHSGVTDRERAVALPGDALVPAADWVTDFAITIETAPAEIWPWLVQMGYGRAGWYGWYPYENGGRGSTDEIVESLQHLALGDRIPDGPRAAEGFGVWSVQRLDRDRALVLHSRRHLMSGLEVAPDVRGLVVDCSWAFVLEPVAAHRTRLHVRVRAALQAGRSGRLLGRVARLVFGLGDSVMENTMVDGIRRRAEAHAGARRPRIAS